MQALTDRPITIFGNGRQTRSFCYVDDLVDGLIGLMSSAEEITGPINLGNPEELAIGELAAQVVELTNSRSEIVYRPLPEDDPKQRRPDITKAKALLGWTPRVGLLDGLKMTIAYFEGLASEGVLKGQAAGA